MVFEAEKASEPETILLSIAGGKTVPCAELFGRGVRIRLQTGVSVRELICGQLAVEGAYLEDRIQTVFLNGRAVDDLDQSLVFDGDVLSLSAAMPGLVGATLRRGGKLAALRKNISYAGTETDKGSGPGTVTIKLFNMVAKELGPHFLQRGVLVAGKVLAGLLASVPGDVISAIKRNGAPVLPEDLSDLTGSGAEIFLKTASPPE